MMCAWRAICLATGDVGASLLVGRSLAVICHPVLAWRLLRPSGRMALAAGYAGLAYVMALLTLFALQG
jgi:hypothetical protein